MIDLIEGASASWPVTMGSGFPAPPYPCSFSALRMPRDIPSYGERTASMVWPLYSESRILFMRFSAVGPSQRSVVT